MSSSSILEHAQASMITCDLCGKAKECLQKEVDGKECDICSECWNALDGWPRPKSER